MLCGSWSSSFGLVPGVCCSLVQTPHLFTPLPALRTFQFLHADESDLLRKGNKNFIFTRTFNTALKWYFHLEEKLSFSLSTDLLHMVTSMQDFQSSFPSHLWALLLLHLLFLLCAINLKNDRQASHFCSCLVSGQFHHQVLRMKLQSFTNSFGRGNVYYQGKAPSKRSLSLWQSKPFRFHTLTYPDPSPALW